MKHRFFDIKERKKIELDVTEKENLSTRYQEKYAFRAVTEDGRKLTSFVSKELYDQATDVPEVGAKTTETEETKTE